MSYGKASTGGQDYTKSTPAFASNPFIDYTKSQPGGAVSTQPPPLQMAGQSLTPPAQSQPLGATGESALQTGQASMTPQALFGQYSSVLAGSPAAGYQSAVQGAQDLYSNNGLSPEQQQAIATQTDMLTGTITPPSQQQETDFGQASMTPQSVYNQFASTLFGQSPAAGYQSAVQGAQDLYSNTGLAPTYNPHDALLRKAIVTHPVDLSRYLTGPNQLGGQPSGTITPPPPPPKPAPQPTPVAKPVAKPAPVAKPVAKPAPVVRPTPQPVRAPARRISTQPILRSGITPRGTVR